MNNDAGSPPVPGTAVVIIDPAGALPVPPEDLPTTKAQIVRSGAVAKIRRALARAAGFLYALLTETP